MLAVALHEPYWKIGGPEPYHDSYTVPVFTREDVSWALVAEVRDACLSLDAIITNVHWGAESP